MEEGRSAFKILTAKPTGKTSLGKPRNRWEGNIKMDIKYVNVSNMSKTGIELIRLTRGIIGYPL